MDKNTSEIVDILNTILATMATKDDVENGFAALRKELNEFKIETHENFASVRSDIRDLRSEIKDIRSQLETLQSDMQSVKGFAKEIDLLASRVRAIETHLGIHQKIAA